MTELSPSDGGSSGSKRRRTSGVYSRKRAVTACQPCRLRKTKCDNMRPVCGFCQNSGGHCEYPDAVKDYSSYDPASLAILDRINHVVRLLEAGHPGHPGRHPADPTSEVGAAPLASAAAAPPDAHPTAAALTSHEEDPLRALDAPDFLAASTNCEGVLSWPVFRDDVSEIYSFVFEDSQRVFEAERGQDLPGRDYSGNLGRGVQEEDFVPLSRRFLSYIHVKNPILDVVDFKAKVKDAAENGTRWDAPSCLVLIACGLGALASPLSPDPGLYETPESVRSSGSVSIDVDTAMTYYLAARKRLGLLRPSLIHVQCLFLCGVFEMCLLNALQAWFYFNQACVQFQNLLWTRSRREGAAMVAVSREMRRLEQRLYWSCMKSECELRSEIPLPPSGITRFDYPDLFPSPPTELASPTDVRLHPDGLENDIEPEEERSWYYYLTEISFRRMMNRAIVTVGHQGVQGWSDNVEENIKTCHDFNEQINLWCSHIPPQIDIGHGEAASNELAHLIRNRARACREWIHRPFVYYLVHHASDAAFDDVAPRVLPLAQRCLELCVDLTVQSYSHHRHHGTWFVSRSCATRALLLLAAARSARIPMPDRWMEAVDVATRTMQLWSAEAPDLRRTGEVLNEVVSRTYAQLQNVHS